jgi:hypothetical protein
VFDVSPMELLTASEGARADHPAVIAARSLAGRIADLVAVAGDRQATARAGGQAADCSRGVRSAAARH